MVEKRYAVSEIIDMAWCDKTSFDDIERITGLPEKRVIHIMRSNLKPSSFKLWRKRVSGRLTKHCKLSSRVKHMQCETVTLNLLML